MRNPFRKLARQVRDTVTLRRATKLRRRSAKGKTGFQRSLKRGKR